MKILTEGANSNIKEMDIIKGKLDEKADEKKNNMRDELSGLDDDEGGMGEHQEIIDEEELKYM